MPVSYAELKAMLDVDEPDYAALAAKAAGALHHVRKLAASDDVSVASKAVSLAGMIGDAGSVGVVGEAARSRHVLVRVAAAHAAGRLPASPQSARVVNRLLDDKDLGVAKLATRAAARHTDPAMAAKAKRTGARVASTARAMVREHAQRERATVMALKAVEKAGSKAAGRKTGKNGAKAGQMRAGQMPDGAMSEPPKGAKARTMPVGKMK